MLEKSFLYIKNNVNIYFDYVKQIYEFKEIGLQEFKSSNLLCSILEDNNFKVERKYFLDTAFKATYDSKKPGLNIGLLCEYDALPEIGHGCGHNLIGVISLLTSIASKNLVDNYGGKITVIGTPAEENYGGKIILDKNNAFDNLDICLMLHPDNKNGLGSKTTALIPVSYEFYGKSAHAAFPYAGKSSLDAAVLTFQGINMLRQFIKPEGLIHGIIKDGGKAANIIPEYAKLEYYFRASTLKYAEIIKEKADKIALGIAESLDLKVDIKIYEAIYGEKLINYKLNDILEKAFKEEDMSYEPLNEIPHGSSDIGIVSYKVPTLEGHIKICDDNILCHSKEFALKTISDEGLYALEKGAKVLVRTIYYLLTNKLYYQEIKEEFKRSII